MFSFKGDTIWQKLWSLIRSLLTLPRFDLFLQGTLLILTFLDGYAYLLLRRSAQAGELSKDVEDWVFMGVAGAEVLFGTLLSWYGRGRRHFALSAWLLVTAVSEFLVLAFPEPELEFVDVELCTDIALSPPVDFLRSSISTLRITILIILAILCALTRISVWAHGITYLDDHDPKNGPYFYGILISIRISMGTNSRNLFEMHALGNNWWKGQLSFSALILMFAILFTLFPKRMPGWNVDADVEKGKVGLWKTIKRLLENKVFLVQILALTLLNTGVWGFILNESEFARARYNIQDALNWSDGRNSRLIGDVSRTLVIVFFVAIFRARFSGRRAEGVKASTAAKVGGVLAIMAAAFFLVIAVLDCHSSEVAGAGDLYEQPECSRQCGCSSEQYGFAPVCVLNSMTTYFSPCHAGCTEYEDIHGFMLLHNCTCGDSGRAVRGACNLSSCSTNFTVYQIVYIIALALSAAALLMQGMVLLRAVRPSDKSVSIGFAFGLIGLLAHVPGHFIFKVINDRTCVYKDGTSCLLHSASFGALIGGGAAALLCLSGVASLGAFILTRTTAVVTRPSEPKGAGSNNAQHIF